MSEDMAAVLGRHREAEVETVQGWVMACDCGWTSEGEKSGDDALFAHIARALADAGFGAVGEAKADAAYWNGELRDEYARRRQATMRAEAAEAALASAKAEALREAADALDDHSVCSCEPDNHLGFVAGSDWLRDRADQITRTDERPSA